MSATESHLPIEETVVIVGVGMIGGSLAAAIKRRGLARKVIGVGRDLSRIESARSLGLIDEAVVDLAAALEQATLAVFCTPVDRVADDVRRAAAIVASNDRKSSQKPPEKELLFTDVGSVKASICSELVDIPKFVGSHPIAGSHKQGFEAANPELFQGRICVVTPMPATESPQTDRVERLWRAVGMETVRMSPEAHDSALAMTSHLPHVVAASLASTLTEQNRLFTGTGFRDTTRIAAGDSDLWAGILMGNATEVVRGIRQLEERLADFRSALAAGDQGKIRELLEEGKQSRRSLDETRRT